MCMEKKKKPFAFKLFLRLVSVFIYSTILAQSDITISLIKTC